MRAYTSTQSKALDLAAQAEGTPGFELMRRAGMAAFQEIGQQFPQANRLLVIAGKGNNGGDAWILAGAAHAAGWTVHLWQAVGDLADLTGEAGLARDWALEKGLGTQIVDRHGFDELAAPPRSMGNDLATTFTVVVDGLLGTGLSSAPRGQALEAIEWINQSGHPCVALDLPSGLNADNGAAPGAVVLAALTLTFIGIKLGLLTGKGPDCCGEVVLARLGLDVERLAGADAGCVVWVEPLEPPPARRSSAHKNMFGHVAVLGGDHGGGGAAIMAAESALRTGAGLVSVGTRAAHIGPMLARRPEVMAREVEGKLAALELLNPSSVIVVGPGLGTSAWGAQLYAAAVAVMASASTRVAVVDADALNLVADGAPLPERSVITPHPGEAARLLGCDTATVEADRVAAVTQLAANYGCIAVLKGAGTLVADPGGLVSVCSLGNPGMATAGMGDTLAGILAGTVAQQGFSAQSVGYAVALHSAAGDRAAARLSQPSLVALDLLSELPALLRHSV